MYIKVKNGFVEKYPYTISDLKKDNPQTSFPANITDALLKEFGVFKIKNTPTDTSDLTKVYTEGTPKLVDGVWKQTWIESVLSDEDQLAKVLELRAREYPPITDYIDGVVKGDQEQIDKYIADCLAVKAKYPKP